MNRSPSASTRLASLRESVIREMTRLALQHNAVNLSQGFPDFAPAPEIIAAAQRALDDGFNQYAVTWGDPALGEAIQNYLRKWYMLDTRRLRHCLCPMNITRR